MRVLDIQARDIHATLEIPSAQIKMVTRFLDKAIPLYDKVYGDEDDELRSFIQQGFNDVLKQLLKEIEENVT